MICSPTVVPATADVRQSFPDITALGYRLQLASHTEPIGLALSAEWHRLHERWRHRCLKGITADPFIAAYAEVYERFGLDPAETTSSMQKLIERYLLSDSPNSVPTIHPIVNVVNVAAVDSLIPLRTFDVDRTDGSLRLELTTGGESFHPLGAAEPTTLPANVLVFRDDETVLSRFGYRDGEKRKITANTKCIWLLGCRNPGVSNDVRTGLNQALNLLQRGSDVELALE
ncbi:phenylalanine--tRNA ligase beta subunit-related protein [Natrinema hispanicum]|uniref:B3/B4 domain-containing protein (DNA/RNA-binding domain of Phe-tRNA-synthetase) n=1 Tax=Natrinema hispanicum TaxID=392421 RepID=A0A1G6YHR3_9EURY|nr:phenylalanine--tRNA ligase beta subunit-related protein [Natrinema hispanicum]SDD90034.1 B3/B4 domain-containing protein (DNA/RNA-binding domain of Phe-tRNA-synthetase) [Natrinema hispanicum]